MRLNAELSRSEEAAINALLRMAKPRLRLWDAVGNQGEDWHTGTFCTIECGSILVDLRTAVIPLTPSFEMFRLSLSVNEQPTTAADARLALDLEWPSVLKGVLSISCDDDCVSTQNDWLGQAFSTRVTTGIALLTSTSPVCINCSHAAPLISVGASPESVQQYLKGSTVIRVWTL
jgi:hypothetical protein